MPAIPFQIQDTASAEPEYTLAPDVILMRVQDGTLRLINLSGHAYAVPAVGARMLSAVLEQGVIAAVQQVTTQYRVDPRQVRTDLETFMQDLERRRLIYRRHARRPGYQVSTRLPQLLFSPALSFVQRRLGDIPAAAWMLLALARLSFYLFGWTRTLTVWQQRFQSAGEPVSTGAQQAILQVVDEAVRRAAAKHIFRVECKERALTCWALARVAGVPVKLVIGVHLFPLQGHCWCALGSHIFGDDHDRCKEYTPVAIYS